ncbi:MAG: alpha/beta hydrolase [Alphaproteobacteria bacterium]|nr:alpha/beta hydrolase [Alphaproteobacteria bacterium]
MSEHPAIIAGWAADAAAFRAAHPPRLLAYGPSPRQAMDIFGPVDAPVALFIHGGYWQKLDRSFFSHMARGLLAHGVAVAVLGYDMCPQVTLREIVAQCRAACAALAQPALAFGHSAGGHLSAMLLAGGIVPAALPVSGVFDVTPLRHTTIGDALRLDADEAHALSPLFMPAPSGRMNAVVGGAESRAFRGQTRAMAQAWGASAEELPGENHFTVIESLAEAEGVLTRAALRLLA